MSSFCCGAFQLAYDRIDEGGMSIVPRQSPSFGPYFELTFNALCAADRSATVVADVKIYLDGRQVIKFCPFCGTNLRDFYTHKPDIEWRESTFPEDNASGAT